ncbi:pyrroline-5-carboxylate reductase [Peptococcus simiae]|uniref:pyrroline-5-carboxylate reductase n=1 Tax=Peptococcus simiae TaxID=1643805 RepID=UPI00397F28C1
MKNIGFIGCGAMAQAMMPAIKTSGLDCTLAFSQRNRDHGRAFADRLGVRFVPNNSNLYGQVDVVVLAVKPQQLADLDLALAPGQETPLVLSLLAGTPLGQLRQALGHDRLIRVMPNVAASVAASMTVMAAGPGLSQEDIDLAKRILDTIGRTVILDEEGLDKAGALNGCGPAFFFQIMEACADALVALGIPRAISYEIAAQTMKGSADLALADQTHPAVLKDKVTSPGGTTIAGVCAMEKAGVRSGLIEAILASYGRTKEMSQ